LCAQLRRTSRACGGGNEGGGTAAQDATPDEISTELALPEVEEPPPSVKQLLGTWSQTGSSTLFRFNRDGTFDVDTHRLDDPLYATGPYELDGSTLVFTSSSPACADEWEWQIGIAKAETRSDDELHVVFQDEGCDVPPGAEFTLARIR
jgi:hypothetical protein